MERTSYASLVFFGGIKILLAARPSDFKILIGRGEGSWEGRGGESGGGEGSSECGKQGVARESWLT